METGQPDNTALRTALWRALHVLADDPPYVITDKIGYELIKPDKDWLERRSDKLVPASGEFFLLAEI